MKQEKLIELKVLLKSVDEEYTEQELKETLEDKENEKEFVNYLQRLRNDSLVAMKSFVKVDVSKFCEYEYKHEFLTKALEIIYLFN